MKKKTPEQIKASQVAQENINRVKLHLEFLQKHINHLNGLLNLPERERESGYLMANDFCLAVAGIDTLIMRDLLGIDKAYSDWR